MIEPFETERLRIRDVEASDRDAFYGYMQRGDYWCDVPMDIPTPQSVDALVTRCIREQSEVPRSNYFLAAVSKESGETIGEAILHIENRWHQRAEIGWGVDGRHAGHGFGTEIGRAMLRFGFDLGLHRLHAQCRVGNARSLRIMAKLGMAQEGIVRENVRARGEWWSSAQWSILRTDYAG